MPPGTGSLTTLGGNPATATYAILPTVAGALGVGFSGADFGDVVHRENAASVVKFREMAMMRERMRAEAIRGAGASDEAARAEASRLAGVAATLEREAAALHGVDDEATKLRSARSDAANILRAEARRARRAEANASDDASFRASASDAGSEEDAALSSGRGAAFASSRETAVMAADAAEGARRSLERGRSSPGEEEDDSSRSRSRSQSRSRSRSETLLRSAKKRLARVPRGDARREPRELARELEEPRRRVRGRGRVGAGGSVEGRSVEGRSVEGRLFKNGPEGDVFVPRRRGERRP